MRIVVFVEHYPPYMGSDKRIYELMKRISKRQEVHFIVFPAIRKLTRINYERKFNEGKGFKDNICPHYFHLSGFIMRIWRYNFYIGYVISFFPLLFSSIKLISAIKPKVIVLNYPSPYTGLIGLLVGKLLCIPVILDFNDLIAQYAIILANLSPENFISKLLIKIQDIIAKYSTKIVVITSFIKLYCAKRHINIDKITIIPNGIDLKLFRSKDNHFDNFTNSKFTCACAGHLEKRGIWNIIKQMAILDDSIRYLVIGAESFSQCPGNIISLGYLPPKKIPVILKKTDCVLVPFPFNEMTNAISPLKLFEGMAAGRPVVAANLAGIRDVIKNGYNGILVNSEDPNDWLKAVKRIAQEKKLAEEIAKNALEDVKKYDWEVLAKKFEEVVYEVVKL